MLLTLVQATHWQEDRDVSTEALGVWGTSYWRDGLIEQTIPLGMEREEMVPQAGLTDFFVHRHISGLPRVLVKHKGRKVLRVPPLPHAIPRRTCLCEEDLLIVEQAPLKKFLPRGFRIGREE